MFSDAENLKKEMNKQSNKEIKESIANDSKYP